MKNPKAMIRFGLVLLGLLIVSCGNQASSQSTATGREEKVVIAFSSNNLGEIAPCG